MRRLGFIRKKSANAERDYSPVDLDRVAASLRPRLSWDEIDALTIGRLVFELGSTQPRVDEDQARRQGAARVFDQIREKFSLSRVELRDEPPDRVEGWIVEIT